MTVSARPQRHRWGEPNRLAQKTERECLRGCRTFRITFHLGGRHWVEFHRDGDKIGGARTPVCEPIEVEA
jgi:hypothetical protein